MRPNLIDVFSLNVKGKLYFALFGRNLLPTRVRLSSAASVCRFHLFLKRINTKAASWIRIADCVAVGRQAQYIFRAVNFAAKLNRVFGAELLPNAVIYRRSH